MDIPDHDIPCNYSNESGDLPPAAVDEETAKAYAYIEHFGEATNHG